MISTHPRLKNVCYGLVSSLVLLVLAASAKAQLKSGACADYAGILGTATSIGMNLSANDQQLSGSYFYKAHLIDIPLSGQYTAPRDITLSEKGQEGAPGGVFILHFPESDHALRTSESLQAEVLTGKWTSADGKTSYAVQLHMQQECAPAGQSRYAVAGAMSDAVVEKNAQAFYAAVIAGNSAKAVQFVAFPCTYFAGAKRLTINTAAEFLGLYPQIFTPAFVSQIVEGTPHHMFANAQGIMIASGKVWFDANGKAIHFNNGPQN